MENVKKMSRVDIERRIRRSKELAQAIELLCNLLHFNLSETDLSSASSEERVNAVDGISRVITETLLSSLSEVREKFVARSNVHLLLQPVYRTVDAKIALNSTSATVDLKHATFKDVTGKAFAEAYFTQACALLHQRQSDRMYGFQITPEVDYKLHRGQQVSSQTANAPDLRLWFKDTAGKVVGWLDVECKTISSQTRSAQVHVTTNVKSAHAYFVVMTRGSEYVQPSYSLSYAERLFPEYITACVLVDTAELYGTWTKKYFRVNLDTATTDTETKLTARGLTKLRLAARVDNPCLSSTDPGAPILEQIVSWLHAKLQQLHANLTRPKSEIVHS